MAGLNRISLQATMGKLTLTPSLLVGFLRASIVQPLLGCEE